MSTNYPSAKDSFTDPAGTQYQDVVDHAAQHTNANDAIVAIETTVGTTAGTNVLKNFAAGDLAVRHNTSGVITSTLNVGTIGTLNSNLGTIGSIVSNTGTIGTINPGTYISQNTIPGSALSTSAIFLGGTNVIGTTSGITTISDLSNATVTVVFPSGNRRAKISALALARSTVANDSAVLSLREGTTILAQAIGMCPTSGGGVTLNLFYTAVITGTHTYKLSGNRDVGSGTLDFEGFATSPIQLNVELI